MKQKNNKTNNNTKNKSLIIILTLLIVIVAEIFVFNFRFFTTMGYEPINLENCMLDGNINVLEDSHFKFTEDNGTIRFYNINKEIKNVYIDAQNTFISNGTDYNSIKENKKNTLIKVKVNADDYGNSNGINMPERSIVSTIEKTKYIPLNLKGETKNMSIEFRGVKNKELVINSITLNKSVPFHFSLIRVIVILVAIGILYIIRPKSKFYNYQLNIKSSKQRILIPVLIALQIAVMMTAGHINPMYVYNTVSWQNQYNELADAIIDGHYYINADVDPKLSELENPYDPAARESVDASVNWDHAYYEGKYYVYFGIVPALIFNIPAKIFADTDISPFACIMTIIPIFVIMSYLLIYALAMKFKSDKKSIPLLIYLIATTIFINGIGTAFLMVWPDMYSLPIFTGLTFAISGLFCWLTAFKENNNDYTLSKPKLLIGSICMALIAGCRPQLVLVIFTAIPIFWNTVFKDRKLFSKSSIANTLLFVVPIAVFALFMFHYNYARFGSPTDFGATYNLTTNDLTSRGICLGRIPQGIFLYILQPLNIKGIFPYIISTATDSNFMGSNYIESMYGGLLFLQPIVWLILFIPKVKATLKEHKIFSVTILFAVFGLLIAVADGLMGGILPRYSLDFIWLFSLSAIATLFALYTKYSEGEYCKLLKYTMPICFIYTMIIAFLIVLGVTTYGPMDTNPEIYWKIATSIQFWL